MRYNYCIERETIMTDLKVILTACAAVVLVFAPGIATVIWFFATR
jgi:hypothetical protein